MRWELRDTEPTGPPSGSGHDRRPDDVIEVRDASRPGRADDEFHPGPDTHLLGLRRDLERIGLEAVEWADAATDALRREAEREAAELRADAVRRADRLLRDAERARIALRSEVRLAAARIWESARDPDASLAETIRAADAAFALPPISWHADAPAESSASTAFASGVPEVVVDDADAVVSTAADTTVPAVPRFEEMLRESPPSAAPPSEPAPAPGAPSATGAPRRRLWLAVGALFVVVLVVGWLVTRSDDSGLGVQPAVTTSPPATTRPGAATTDVKQIADHFAAELAALAPAGQTVASQGAIPDGGGAATGEFEQLAAALATDRSTGLQGTFVSGAGTGRAAASVSVYATTEAAARAYDAAHGYFLSDRRTGAGNHEIELPSNRALRAFGFEHGTGAERTATAYLQFPRGLVELTTSGAPGDALPGMVSVINGWAS